jgi:hypothetical protein
VANASLESVALGGDNGIISVSDMPLSNYECNRFLTLIVPWSCKLRSYVWPSLTEPINFELFSIIFFLDLRYFMFMCQLFM